MLSIRKVPTDTRAVQLRRLICEILPKRGLRLIDDDKRVRWAPRMLVICAMLMQLLDGESLQPRFKTARDTVARMYPSRTRPGGSFAGFMAALQRQGDGLLRVLAEHLRSIIPVLFASHWTLNGRLVFIGDGSRFECPRTLANERKLKCAGRKKTGPQFMLTTLLHAGTGLPWEWRRGSGKSSERGHLREMLWLIPRGAWLLADAGFTGYDLFRQLKQKGIHFVIRAGANVHLLKKLGYDVREKQGVVYLWPQGARRKKQPPMILRLVRFQTGRQVVCLLTDELDEKVLPMKELKELYRRRWMVEVFFRSLKQTVGRGRMQSQTPETAAAELDWSVMAMWVMGVMLLRQMQDVDKGPAQWSVAGALRVIRQTAGEHREKLCSMRRLAQCLRMARKDEYQRHGPKVTREYPRKKNEKPAGAVRLRLATRAEVKQALQMRPEALAA